MKRSSPAATAPSFETGDLVGLFEREGPFLTVWSTTLGEVENPVERAAQVFRSVRTEAAAAGAPEPLIDALERLHAAAPRRGDGLVVVGSGEGVLLGEHLTDPPRRELVAWSVLPSLSAVIEHRQSLRPYVVVLTDRTGADILTVAPGWTDIAVVDETNDQPVTRSAPGGWSQRRFQQRAENTWARNARAVAGEVERAVAACNARDLIVAGDVRATNMLSDDLPDEVRAILHTVPGGRAPDGSADALDAAVDTVVRSGVAADTTDVLHRFAEQRSADPDGSATASGVLSSLSSGRVSVLLVHDDADDSSTAWFDPGSYGAASARNELPDPGTAQEGRLVDVAIRSALLSGALIRVVPAKTLPGGPVGALLRWS
jgi:hypothetical protein